MEITTYDHATGTASKETIPNSSLFNKFLAEDQKTTGMTAAASARKRILYLARMEARRLAKSRTSEAAITADDVMAALLAEGVNIKLLGNAAGSIFQTGEWQWTGQWVKSTRVSNHARYIRSWKYIGA